MGYVTPLAQLGGEIKARVEAADKSLGRAEDLYRSAGVMLMEAKERVKATKGLTWPGWLRDNVVIGPRRADDLIMIAEGRTTLEELRVRNVVANRKFRAEAASRDAKSSEKTQRKQQTPTKQEVPSPHETPKEEEGAGGDECRTVVDRIVARLTRATLEELILAEKTLTMMLGD